MTSQNFSRSDSDNSFYVCLLPDVLFADVPIHASRNKTKRKQNKTDPFRTPPKKPHCCELEIRMLGQITSRPER
ncbi:hypothetical protein BO70DRAFT_112680 [Aspergillus heteromorphus CBS 117.55]|uniref:Uncharacterized protein n=1 Tax=Aspergillus heteromorphus CBS 117.55 TaxID=1448321 RepID=A0A317VLX6_9EURO|nr:uncharacterized protein BO70DRAFT_112680 [Aspergillus heteromorphus CBS 117.55]PWY72910.1 hypothetical protein BO70DRAFT_112680 [Aspergillus heteromorphus CBS 117.55]